MALTPGTRLGTYEILAPLGAGGMGEVYQARDTKLGREVAIKVLPEAFSQDEERLARFEREARLLASLNHPNIATLYGLEQQGGVEFLVMELVPGETLDEVISKRGAALLEDSLPLFRQIAEGLEAAHERGIVHRDLKPANVKVTPEGKVKILDFGLAKAFADEVAPTDLSQSPTVTREGTAAGVIMGTAAYMSPEQARGKPLDKRTDIWSFGCVMFEGLTGAKSFKGETVSDVLAAVLRADPDLNALPPSTPVNVRWLLRRCLQKDPHHRLHDIADARVEIEEAIREPSASTTGLASDRRARWGRAVPWGVSLLALALGTWGLMRPTPSSVPLRRFLVEPPSPQLLGPAPAIALSQSGNVLVYLALTRNDDRLYLRALDRFEAQPIAGTEGARFPFLSPDGEWVGFRVGQKLKKVPSGGGLPVDICDVVDARGASWGPDDWIYYGNASNGLWRVSADGGEPEVVTELDKELGEWTHRFPDVLPGGEAVLFTLGDRSMTGSWDEGNIGVVTVETGQRRTLVKGGMFGRYFEGHLLYVRGGQLMAAPFDRGRLEVTGQAVKVLEDIRSYPAGAAAQLAAAGVGVLAYASGGAQGEEPTQLLWVDRQGNRAPVMDEARAFRQPALSPDGQKLAVVIVRGGNSDLWLYEFARSTLTRLTHAAGEALRPVWTPDGKRVSYHYAMDRPWRIRWVLADGSGAPEQILEGKYDRRPEAWSLDGKLLVFSEDHAETKMDLWTLDQSGVEKPVLTTPFDEQWARLSPNGRWLAYQSNESGRFEVYVQQFPGPGRKWQISTGGGQNPVWARNGRELFYRNGDQMLAVAIQTEPSFVAGRPEVLFEGKYRNRFDVAPDGQRFLMVARPEPPPNRIHVVLNWTGELSELAPTN